jgi:hypothetical protein
MVSQNSFRRAACHSLYIHYKVRIVHLCALLSSLGFDHAITCNLALPVTRKADGTSIIRHAPTQRVAESKPFTHELELLIAPPHNWWPGGGSCLRPKLSTNASDQSHDFRKR